jgi:tRNA threonylcarbamoyladenosine biosynthesis protein TsaE
VHFTICHIEKEFGRLGGYLKSQMGNGRNIVLLKGDLGAGKTTFVKHFVDYLGGEICDVDSPTFSIVNTYKLNSDTIHHFDLYRLNSAEEIEDIGFMEYIDSSDLCFIEWPEKIAEFLPLDRVIHIDIAVSLELCREYTFS